jgi:ABC-2 type transport system ATP-binding protein
LWRRIEAAAPHSDNWVNIMPDANAALTDAPRAIRVSTSMIRIDRFTKRYGARTAVSEVSFEVPRGEVCAFLGPNGAGKTTTIRAITGYHPPTRGTISVDGFDAVNESHDVRRRIGYLPEATPLYTDMRVCEYLTFRAKLFDLPRRDRRPAVERVMERCWLTEMRGRLIQQLSKGYRQRVGLAAALLHRPPVLILDEPTSGLDPTQIRATRRLMRELAGDHTMLISTHILPEAERISDRVVIIAGGRVRADGAPASLMEQHRAGSPCVLECRDPAPARDALGGLGSVIEEPLEEGWHRLRITPRTPADIRADVGAACQHAGLAVRELRSEQVSLEQVFIALTSDDEAADIGGDAAGDES